MCEILIQFINFTVSDSCSLGLAVDASGPHLQDLVKAQFNPTLIKYDIIPDDMGKIEVKKVAFINNNVVCTDKLNESNITIRLINL